MAQIPLFEKRGAGWIVLAANFPATLNKEVAPTLLKVNETPSAYGINAQSEGYLRTGSILTGTARNAPTGTGAGASYNWYYDRLWKATATILDYGAPAYRDRFYRQNLGKFESHANIVTFMPALGASMWVVTATGSHFIENANDTRGYFRFGKFLQELWATSATKAITLDGMPYVSNTDGVFVYDGNKTVELTRLVRGSLGSFSNKAILADYEKKYIIGTDSYMIDTETGKLFDYGTSGFLFTSRTMAQGEEMHPFEVDMVALLLKQNTTAGGTIKWETKIEDNDWYKENDIEVRNTEGNFTRIEFPIENPVRLGHKWKMRITSLSDNVYIKEIQARSQNFAVGSFSQ